MPELLLLTTAGFQVPAMPLMEVAGNKGAVLPEQKGAMVLNVVMVFGVTVTTTSAEVALQAEPPVVTL